MHGILNNVGEHIGELFIIVQIVCCCTHQLDQHSRVLGIVMVCASAMFAPCSVELRTSKANQQVESKARRRCSQELVSWIQSQTGWNDYPTQSSKHMDLAFSVLKDSGVMSRAYAWQWFAKRLPQ